MTATEWRRIAAVNHKKLFYTYVEKDQNFYLTKRRSLLDELGESTNPDEKKKSIHGIFYDINKKNNIEDAYPRLYYNYKGSLIMAENEYYEEPSQYKCRYNNKGKLVEAEFSYNEDYTDYYYYGADKKLKEQL